MIRHEPAIAAVAARGAVLYVLSFLPTYIDWEVRALAARGIAVCVVLPEAWPRAAMWDRITGRGRAGHGNPDIRTADLHGWLARPRRALLWQGAALLARLWWRHPRVVTGLALHCLRAGTVRHLLAAGALAEELGEAPITRVHGHFATDAAWVGALLAPLLGVPFSLTTHAHDIFVPRSRRRVRRLLAAAAPVFTISDYNRAHLRNVAGAAIGGRVRVLRLGVDVQALPRWSPARGPFTIACTASGLGDKKGVGVLIEACGLLAARGFPFRCIVCGADPSGERLAALRQLVRARGLEAHVRLLGAVSWRVTQRLVSRADIFVHPSVRTPAGDMDGIPVSLIEAMGIGVPVVASRLSGIPELVEDGRSGLLLPPGDAAALAAAIARVAERPALAQALGSQGRRRIEQAFGLARYIDDLLDAWNSNRSPGLRAGWRPAGPPLRTALPARRQK